MNVFTFVSGEDWCGIYVGDLLMAEGHSLEEVRVLKLAMEHGPIDAVAWIEADSNWLSDVGSLPRNLSEVKV